MDLGRYASLRHRACQKCPAVATFHYAMEAAEHPVEDSGVFEVGRVYVPHHRLNKRANTLISRASNIDYIDDGLDTRRVTPKNFGAITVLNGSRYFTFKEYQDFPEWMKGLEIRQISSLSSIREGGEHQDNLMNGIENVFIESPGCETDEIVQMLGLSHPA